MTIELKYKNKLKYLRDFFDDYKYEDLDKYELCVWELAKTEDIDVLSELMDLFDDDFEPNEILFSILHAIEIVPKKTLILLLMKKSIDFRNYPEWYTRFVCRILNSEDYYALFLENIHLADRKSILEILDLIYQNSEEHRSQVEFIRKRIIDRELGI